MTAVGSSTSLYTDAMPPVDSATEEATTPVNTDTEVEEEENEDDETKEHECVTPRSHTKEASEGSYLAAVKGLKEQTILLGSDVTSDAELGYRGDTEEDLASTEDLRSKDSFLTFHTEEGCNATLRCTQTGNVTWTRSSTSEVIQEGPRFHPSIVGPYSTLLITHVSEADKGNISCVGQEGKIIISFEVVKVCKDVHSTASCQASLPQCSDEWVMENCRKSCGLCPKLSTTQTSTERKTTPNCFENNATSQRNCIHGFSTPIGTEPSTTQISTERKTTPNRFENNATSQRNGIQGFFMFLSSLLLCLSVPQ
ncbi:uncharacterized protein LOC141868979 isoform X2 [Acropora palmata]|uniref:uncharacterized protein LOC141868979 isoform X2 n=1 Tax=Acropora palmata TaxID=6131 RepID=UPI003DA0FF77